MKRASMPDFDRDPLQWSLIYLRENEGLYAAFRAEMDRRLAASRSLTLGGQQVLDDLRRQGARVRANNNAAALFARLYVSERPQYKDRVERRQSVLDQLAPEAKWQLANAAKQVAERRPSEQRGLFGPS